MILGTPYTYAQNSGIGVIDPTHTFHVKPSDTNPVQDPIRIENLQPFLEQSDSMMLITDPAMGVLRVISLQDVLDRAKDNALQSAKETRLVNYYDFDGDGTPEFDVQEALNALARNLPKGTFKTVGDARAAGLVDGDSFIAHPDGVFGCAGCTIKLHPGMN